MLVSSRMTKFPITIGRMETVENAAKIMQEKKIRHLPVVEGDKLVGLLAFTDIMRAMPSKVSTLEQREASYLFNTVKVKDALPDRQKVITIEENACIEEAALMMRAYKIGALPVLARDGKLVGICTESNIFDAFIDLLGVRTSGSRIEITIGEKPGMLAAITDIIKSFNVSVTRIAMFPIEDKDHHYNIVIRMDTNDSGPIVEALKVHGFHVESSADYSKIYSHLF